VGFEAGNDLIKVRNNALPVCRNEQTEGSGYGKAEVQGKRTGLSIIED
jgi:hypothetical protein